MSANSVSQFQVDVSCLFVYAFTFFTLYFAPEYVNRCWNGRKRKRFLELSLEEELFINKINNTVKGKENSQGQAGTIQVPLFLLYKANFFSGLILDIRL